MKQQLSWQDDTFFYYSHMYVNADGLRTHEVNGIRALSRVDIHANLQDIETSTIKQTSLQGFVYRCDHRFCCLDCNI